MRRLRVELAPSAVLAITLIAAHGAAAACAVAVLPRVLGMAAAMLLMALGVASTWRVALLRARASVRALELAGPALELELASGERFAAEAAERRYVGRFVVILALRRPVRRTVLITRDMARGDAFRRLRIWALWGRLPAVAGKQLAG